MFFECQNYDLYYYQEDKPLMIMVPGAADTINPVEEYIKDGIVSPEYNIAFFRRDKAWAKIDPEEIKKAINCMPRTEVYYCGFSLGAWDFYRYKDLADFTKVILIDGYCTDFWEKESISELYVVQSYENYIWQYEALEYLMPECDIQIFDMTDWGDHVGSYWVTFAPDEEAFYRYRKNAMKGQCLNLLEVIK